MMIKLIQKIIIMNILLISAFALDTFAESTVTKGVVPECAFDIPTDDTGCLVKDIGTYVYGSQYGGRSANGSNLSDNSLSFLIPTGWYEGKTVSVDDPFLRPSFIVKDHVIFGVTGTLEANVGNFCTSDDDQPITSSCVASAGGYIYSSENGGRTTQCSAVQDGSGNVTEACWLDVANQYLYQKPANCTVNGVVGSVCNVAQNKFRYTTEYGGHAHECHGFPNDDACWLTTFPSSLTSGAACVSGTLYDTLSCTPDIGWWVYRGSNEFGGRNIDCTANNAGACWFNAANKSTVDADLTAGNIKSAVTIFGVTGNYTGANVIWTSSMHRTVGTARMTQAEETTTYNGNDGLPLVAGYRPIPIITNDHDQVTQPAGGQKVAALDRTGWIACGAAGDLNTRRDDCAAKNPTDSTWTGSTLGNAGEADWELISRSGDMAGALGREVWRDKTTGLLWTSLVSTVLNWCKASGSSYSAYPSIVSSNLNEVDPAGYCSSATYQNQAVGDEVISACAQLSASGSLVPGLTSTDAAIDNAGKSGLSKSSTPKVSWRLPSMYDYMVADHNGIRFVMPDMRDNGGQEWTATIDGTSVNRSKAWVFDSSTGARSTQTRTFAKRVRCVGR